MKQLRQQISIFLLLLFGFGALVPGQTQEELARMPIVWKHFQVHRTLLPETTFLQYLKLHYTKDFAQHRSSHDHSKLPLKSGDNHLHIPSPAYLTQHLPIYFLIKPIPKEVPVYTNQTYSYLLPSDIWQPPKSC